MGGLEQEGKPVIVLGENGSGHGIDSIPELMAAKLSGRITVNRFDLDKGGAEEQAGRLVRRLTHWCSFDKGTNRGFPPEDTRLQVVP